MSTDTNSKQNLTLFFFFVLIFKWHIPVLGGQPHFTRGGILCFLKHYKHGTMRQHCSNVCKWRPCLDTESTDSARMRTIVTAALQRQYSQTELIFWITLVFINKPPYNKTSNMCTCIFCFFVLFRLCIFILCML